MADEALQPVTQQVLAFLERVEIQLQIIIEAQALILQVLKERSEERQRLHADLRADMASQRDRFTGMSIRDL